MRGATIKIINTQLLIRMYEVEVIIYRIFKLKSARIHMFFLIQSGPKVGIQNSIQLVVHLYTYFWPTL